MCLVAYEHGKTNIKYSNPDNPLWAVINITNHCNMNCGFCFNKGNFESNMSFDEFSIILDKLVSIDIKQISFCGGEPTLHPNLESMLTLVKNSGVKAHLLTNGTKIDFIYHLDSIKLLDQIQFNWNINTYKILLPLIQSIVNTRIAITIPGTEDNINNIEELILSARDNNIDKIRIWELCGSGRTLTSASIQDYDAIVHSLIPNEYSYKQSYDPEIDADLHIPCMIASGVAMFINSNGDIIRCIAELNSPIIANILDDTSDTILKKYKEYISTLSKICYAR